MKLQGAVYYHYSSEETERRIDRDLAVVRHPCSDRQCRRHRAELCEYSIGNPSFYSSKWQTSHRGVPKGVGSEALDSCGRTNDCHYNHHLHNFNHHAGSSHELLRVNRSKRSDATHHHYRRPTTAHLYSQRPLLIFVWSKDAISSWVSRKNWYRI